MDQAGSVGSATRQAWPCRAELARTLTGKFGWTWENLLATFRGGWAMGGGRHGPLGLDCSPLRPDRQPPRPAAAQTGSRPDRQPPRPAAAGASVCPSNMPCGTISSSAPNPMTGNAMPMAR
jgi:hypothetical protein